PTCCWVWFSPKDRRRPRCLRVDRLAAELELRFAAEQQRSVATGDPAKQARSVVCDCTQRDCGDGAASGLEHAAREIIRRNHTERTRFVLALFDERLDQPGDVRDLAAAPEPEQVDEVRPDRAQDATAARCVGPPIPGRVESLRAAVPAQVWL